MVNCIDDGRGEAAAGRTEKEEGFPCGAVVGSFPLRSSSSTQEDKPRSFGRDATSRLRRGGFVCRAVHPMLRRLLRWEAEEDREGGGGGDDDGVGAIASAHPSSSSSSSIGVVSTQRNHPRSTALESSNRVKRCSRVEGGRYSSGVRGPNCCATKEGVKGATVASGDATTVGWGVVGGKTALGVGVEAVLGSPVLQKLPRPPFVRADWAVGTTPLLL